MILKQNLVRTNTLEISRKSIDHDKRNLQDA